MSEAGKARRRAAIAARKQATKARLAEPVTAPVEPVALPWKRRPRLRPLAGSSAVDATLRAGDVISSVVSHDARDLEGSLAVVAAFVGSFGRVLRSGS